jgi:hypothetical protein
VLGKTESKDKAMRLKIFKTLSHGVAEAFNGAFCFDPRHGIRATRNGKTVDLVICFECEWIEGHLNNGDAFGDKVAVSKLPEPLFSRILKKAQIPLDKE